MASGGRNMEYEIVELEEKIVAGIGTRTTNEEGKSIQDIANVWQKLFAEGAYDKISNKQNHKTIGLYTEYEGDYTQPYYFMAGCEVSKAFAKDIATKIIPKGRYAKFVITGDVQNSVGQAWAKIWNMDLQRKYSCDFEEYQNNSEDMQNQEIHIYIAIL